MSTIVKCVRGASSTRLQIVVVALLISHTVAAGAQPVQDAANGQPQPVPSPPPAAASDTPDPHDAMEEGPSRMQIRGFGDIQFRLSNESDVPSTFSIGQLDLFITSQLAGDLNLLGEVVFEADDQNRYTVDVERLLLQFSPSDYFNIGIGRYHTAIGFYNNAYHHGAWFQTALGRPRLFEFEDDEGILPVHGVGITARGQVPSGNLGLRWIFEIGNGRRYGDGEAVQVVQDDSSHKAVNVGFLMRPTAVPGLQSGLSVYWDKPKTASGRVDQSIIAAHVVYQNGLFENLNELVVIRDTPVGEARAATTTGIYTQLSRRFERMTPYIRYEHLDVAQDDPLLAGFGSISGPSIGLRYDFRDLAALKVQWDRFTRRPGADDAVHSVTAQVSFTF